MPTPSFSVIVPSHGRVELLTRLLQSIDISKSKTKANIEVIVVDSSPIVDTKCVSGICNKFGANLIKGQANVRSKRNIGARSASKEWLFFVDSDCKLSKNIFDAYLQKIMENQGAAAIAGPTRFEGEDNYFTRLIQNSALLNPFRIPAKANNLLWATTSNLVVRRDCFKDLGGFREDFPFRLGGDDTDFCLRLRDRHYKLVAAPDAVCSHTWETWGHPLSVMRRSFRWGWMHSILLRDYPHYRRFDAPGLPVHTLACSVIALIGAFTATAKFLLAPVLFFLLSVIIHAFFATFNVRTKALPLLLEDLALALVELPFGFGRALGSLSRGSLIGVLYRLDANDIAMDASFPETVRSLWSDHLSFLIIVLSFGWFL